MQRDDSYDGLKPEVPWASIALAVCLTVFGLVSLVLAWLHFTQAILGKQQAVGGQPWGLVNQAAPLVPTCLHSSALCPWLIEAQLSRFASGNS